MIDNATEIINAANIEAVIREYAPDVTLEKAGTNFKACCPFHSENTPSFTISPSKGIFKCFGCGKGGDAVNFVMEHLRVTFPEALEKVAAVSKLKVRYAEGVNRAEYIAKKKEENDRRASLTATFKLAADWYAANAPSLLQSPENAEMVDVAGRAYLKSTIERFGVFAPHMGLAEYAAQQKWNLDTLKEIGLLDQSERGWFDIYRGRFLFLLRDHAGRAIGLAGRLPKGSDSKAPKYINPKGSDLYNKSEVLYGFDLARKAIHNTETVYLVEGYTDCLTCSEFGLENVAATCGTALTDEHCRLLKRYGVKYVVLFRDGDKAGQEATRKDVFTIVKNGLKPKVLICDAEHDPDSQVRQLGEKGFRGFREKEQDGMIWRCMSEWDKKDPVRQIQAQNVAAELVALLPDNLERSTYIRALCQPETMGNNLKAIEAKVHQILTAQNTKKRKRSDLETEAAASGIAYGVFENTDDTSYYRWNEGQGHTKISNFIIRPAYLIRDREQPRRIVEIVNTYGHTAVLNVTTDVFGTMQKFRDELGKHGNFLFTPAAKAVDFNMIVGKIYDMMNDAAAYRIISVGWHHRGFWVWNNGISLPDGTFLEPDEFGLVAVDGVKYLLPGRANVADNDNFDKAEEDDGYIKACQYYRGEDVLTFGEWNKLFHGLYADNGMVATGLYLATLFSDIIFPKRNGFPLLNCFGDTGKGKSTMLRSLGFMFGFYRTAGVLGTSTYTSLFRTMAQCSNMFVFWEEFHNQLELKTWIKPMMNFYDRDGRALAIAEDKSKTTKTVVKGVFCYAGQEMPVKNGGALLNRSLSLSFNHERTDESERAYDAFHKIEVTGKFSRITASLLKYREKVEREWDTAYQIAKSDLYDFMKSSDVDLKKIESRILHCHLVPLTMYVLLKDDLEFAFSYLDFVAFTSNLIEGQANIHGNNNETGQFWKVLSYLANNGRVRHYKDILVEMRDKVTVEKGRKDTDEIIFRDKEGNVAERRVVFLRHTDAHIIYAEQMRSINKDALDLSSLEHYLRTSPAFLGISKGKKFAPNRPAQRCWVFDADAMDGVELLLSVEARAQGKDGEEGGEPDGKGKEDTPF